MSNTNSPLRITHRVLDKQNEQFKSSRDLWRHDLKDVLFDVKYLYYCCSIGRLQIPQQEKTPSELLMKRVLRTRLSLVKPTVGGEIRDRQESQTEAASGNREMLPGESVAVWNPRQDSQGTMALWNDSSETGTEQLSCKREWSG